MSIGAISGLSSIQFDPIQSQSTNSARSTQRPPDSDNDGGAKVSQRGKFFSELQQLAQSDPAQFKQVTSEIASKLKAAAQSQTGGDSQSLNALADRFQQASQSGNFADIAPQQVAVGAHAAHGHNHHGASAYSQQQQSDQQSLFGGIFQLVDQAATPSNTFTTTTA